MKTKIMIGGLLAVLMLVTLPILTASKDDITATTTPNEILVEETPRVVTPPVEEDDETTIEEDTTDDETTERDEAPKKTKHFDFVYVKATFSPLNEWDFSYTNGKLFFTDIVINSKDDSLTTNLKINGNTIVQRKTPVKIEIETMSVLAFRPRMTAYVALNPSYKIVLSGFASDITVTY